MYVMEHVRIEISKSALSRLRDSKVDAMRATALLYKIHRWVKHIHIPPVLRGAIVG
jgi:hypothetical protein